MKRLPLLVVALASITALAVAAKALKKEVHLQQSDLQWTQPFGPQGPTFGFVVGAFGDKHPASFFAKFPAGADSGWHIHDEDYEAVVLKGTFSEQQQGEPAETALPTGTFFSEPARINHRNGCSKEGDCLVFVHFALGASSHPTTPDGKLLPPPGPAAKASR